MEEDSVTLKTLWLHQIQKLEDDNKKRKIRLITAANCSSGNMNTVKKKNKKNLGSRLEEKQLYGYFKRQTSEIAT